MACEYICDGCGRRESAVRGLGEWLKPCDWFQRSDYFYGAQDACSRKCIDAIAKATGKTGAVIPV